MRENQVTLANPVHSMVEHSVALIVGSMPALAALIKVQAAKSTVFSTARSKIFGTNPSKPSSNDSKPSSVEYQGNSRRARAYYYELNDSTLETRGDMTRIEAGGYPPPPPQKGTETGIVMTTKISQESFIGSAI